MKEHFIFIFCFKPSSALVFFKVDTENIFPLGVTSLWSYTNHRYPRRIFLTSLLAEAASVYALASRHHISTPVKNTYTTFCLGTTLSPANTVLEIIPNRNATSFLSMKTLISLSRTTVKIPFLTNPSLPLSFAITPTTFIIGNRTVIGDSLGTPCNLHLPR